MKARGVLTALLLAACEGEVLGGLKDPVKYGTGVQVSVEAQGPDYLDTVAKAAPQPDGPFRFATLTWDLETELATTGRAMLATVSLDVRPSEGGLELLNPRFALKPAASRQLTFSKLLVTVAATQSAAFSGAFTLAASTAEQVANPGLIAFAKADGAVQLRFVAAELAAAPMTVEQEMAAADAGTLPGPVTLVDGDTYALHSSCADHRDVISIADAALTENALAIFAPVAAGRAEQHFTLSAHPMGGLTLTAKHSGMALNVPRGSLTAGTQLIQWHAADNAHPNQRFIAEREADGSYRFKGVQSGLYLDAMGTAVVQAADGASCAQRFMLERVE